MNIEILRTVFFVASIFFGYNWIKAIIQNRGRINLSHLYFVAMVITSLFSVFLRDSSLLFKEGLSIIAVVFVANWFVRFAQSQDGILDLIALLTAMSILVWISGQTFYSILIGLFAFLMLCFKAVAFWYLNADDIIEYQKMVYHIEKHKISKVMTKLSNFQRNIQASITSRIIIFLWRRQR